MCGIIGYAGKKVAAKVLINSLRRLEYRGYDSAGIAVLQDGSINFSKKAGKLHVLTDELKRFPLEGNIGAGHVRWATHGVPNEVNAHPHLDCTGKIAVVHNGIIENYQALKTMLIKEGHKFVSDTDTEVIPHLIEKYYKGYLLEAVRQAVKLLKGSYAICCLHASDRKRMVGARCDSPLIIGAGKNENFFASDAPAILDYTKNVIFLNNYEIAEISKNTIKIININGKTLSRKPTRIKWNISQAEKSGFKHFMLKEIFEQSNVVGDILKERLKNNKIHFEELAIKEKVFKGIKNMAIVACGTAYHAALTGKYMLEDLAEIPVWVDTSSEFRYRKPIVGKNTLVILISQSGETADTLHALREAKKRKAKTLAVCNVLGSSIAREADGVIYTHAGPEIAVASTKAYTAQLAILYLLTIYIGRIRGVISGKTKKKLLKEFKKIPRLLKLTLNDFKSNKNKIAEYAKNFRKYYLEKHNKSTFLYLARNINYPNALEGALKLKEISYITAEGYPAGEMKHGPIALIDENPWVVCIATKAKIYEKMLSNIQEIKARGGIIIAIATKGDKEIASQNVNYVVKVPEISELFSPILVAIPLQLLAYYVAREFGYDIDQPRNLAKSVTVE
ncbi:MAG: glutamine--fructose-6-phosphate transaminase (isomerizing) [Candidatus Omnitrophica bacterium]|nr:glutamine--fructose-6-phosphate transaminase (isomerizing) [Candidatus Omnitrophota bacterium]